MMLRKKMYAVGPEDDSGWEPISAVSKSQAQKIWRESNGDIAFSSNLDAIRVEFWDHLNTVHGPDWLSVGLFYTCSQCSEMAGHDTDPPATVIDGEVYCGDCAGVDT